MQRSVKEFLGGGLRPNDPRRFLVEAMVGAMTADGHADPRELQMMQKIIAEHELFHERAITDVPLPDGRVVPMVGVFPRLSKSPGAVTAAAAMPGQHTREVLAAAGVSDDELARLEQAGVIGTFSAANDDPASSNRRETSTSNTSGEAS